MDLSSLKTEPVNLNLIEALKKKYRGLDNEYFLITTGSLKNCVLTPSWHWASELHFNNDHSGRSVSVKFSDLFYLPDYKGPKHYSNAVTNRAAKNNVEQGVDKYGGTVMIDSYVAYFDSNKRNDDGLNVGVVTKITKANRIDLIDVLTGESVSLPNSRRYFVIDEGLLSRLMVMKISRHTG